MPEKTITLRQASEILGIPEKEIVELAFRDEIPHIKVDDGFLRFHKEDIFKIKPQILQKYNINTSETSGSEKVKDFFYFNDFYIISFILIAALLIIIFKKGS